MPDLRHAHGAERVLLQVRQLRGHKRMLLKRDCCGKSQAIFEQQVPSYVVMNHGQERGRERSGDARTRWSTRYNRVPVPALPNRCISGVDPTSISDSFRTKGCRPRLESLCAKPLEMPKVLHTDPDSAIKFRPSGIDGEQYRYVLMSPPFQRG